MNFYKNSTQATIVYIDTSDYDKKEMPEVQHIREELLKKSIQKPCVDQINQI